MISLLDLSRGGYAAAAVLALALLPPPRGGAQERAFTRAEQSRLEAGRLVARPVQRERGGQTLIGGTSWQVVDQPPPVTWAAVANPQSYGRMLPEAEEARVVAHRGEEAVVRIRHRYGLLATAYHLRMRFDHASRDVTFRLDAQRPNDLRAAYGFLELRPYDEGRRTLLVWGVMADPGGGVLGGLIRGRIHDSMLRVPSSMRRYVHQLARERASQHARRDSPSEG